MVLMIQRTSLRPVEICQSWSHERVVTSHLCCGKALGLERTQGENRDVYISAPRQDLIGEGISIM